MSSLSKLLSRPLPKRNMVNGNHQIFYIGFGLGSLLAINAS